MRRTRTRERQIETYLDFPPGFASFIEQFAKTEHIIQGPLPRKHALAYQFQLGKFRAFLRRAPPDDEYARSLLEIADTMMCSRTTLDSDPTQVTLEWYINPITSYMRSLQREETKP